MNTKKQLKKRIADLEKECKWVKIEKDVLKNNVEIQLLEKKKYINEVTRLNLEIEDVKNESKRWQEMYNREYDKAREAETMVEYLHTCIGNLQSKDLNNNRKIKSLEKENENLRKTACVGEMLSILGSNLNLIKENIQLEDKIDRISAILKED